jgi:hypothetical protein
MAEILFLSGKKIAGICRRTERWREFRMIVSFWHRGAPVRRTLQTGFRFKILRFERVVRGVIQPGARNPRCSRCAMIFCAFSSGECFTVSSVISGWIGGS